MAGARTTSAAAAVASGSLLRPSAMRPLKPGARGEDRRCQGRRIVVRPEIRALQEALAGEGYIAEPAIATALFLAQEMNKPLYEWNYQRQLLRLRIAERDGQDPSQLEDLIFGREYLLERPLLRAITRREGPAVLLVNDIERADEGFEAFLLEVLSDFQVTIPELGTIKAEHVPFVVLTSNRSREIGDALR